MDEHQGGNVRLCRGTTKQRQLVVGKHREEDGRRDIELMNEGGCWRLEKQERPGRPKSKKEGG